MSLRTRRRNAPKGIEIKHIRIETQVAVWNPPSSPYDDPVYSFIRPDLTVEDLKTFTLEKDTRRYDPTISAHTIYQNWLRSVGWEDDDEMEGRSCDDEITKINHRRVRFADEEFGNNNQEKESPLVFSPPNFSPQEDLEKSDSKMDAVTEFFPSLTNTQDPNRSAGLSSPNPHLNINPNPFPHFSILKSSFPPLLPTFNFPADPPVDVIPSSSFFSAPPMIRPPSLSPQPKKFHLVTDQPHSAFNRVIPMEEMFPPVAPIDSSQLEALAASMVTPSMNIQNEDKHDSDSGFFIPTDVIETLAQMS